MMFLATVSLSPVAVALQLSLVFALTIAGILLLRRPNPKHLRFAIAIAFAVIACLLTVSPAQAADTIIINAQGCKVTEEDALGFQLHQDLYLRIDYPNTHWRFGLRNMGLKGTQALDISIQGAQYSSPQYIIKRAGMAELFVPYDDRSETYYDMSFGYDRMDQMDPADLPSTNAALVYFRTQQGNH